jgi:hypothetical protein
MPAFLKLPPDSAITSWDELVQSSPVPATIAHNPLFFSFYSDFLSLSPFYFILKENKVAVGLFPVVKSGKSFISMPHFSYGGIYWLLKAKKITIPEEEKIVRNLIAEIEKENLEDGYYTVNISDLKTEKFPTGKIEIRSETPFFGNSISEKTRHFIYLKKSKEEQWESFSSNLRRKISKAEKNGIVVKKGKEDLLNDFVKVYQKNMHKLGSPAFGKSFFQALLQISGANPSIFVAYFQHKPIGAAFCLPYFDFIENSWFSTISKYNKYYPAYLLHWKMIEDAINQKKKIYSLGRSTTNSGVHEFKKQWQTDEKPLYFSKNVQSKFNLKEQKWLTKIWKVLPSAVVNQVGPFVAKRIY